MSEQKAGDKILKWFLTDPRGEEVLEGTLGGLMAGGALIGSGEAPGEIALKTAMAILGGIGLGSAGRYLGAKAGRAIGKGQPLRDQSGMIATLARTMGSESTSEGLAQQGQVMKTAVQEALVNETSAQMAREAAANPAAFMQRHGITKDQFESMMPMVQQGRAAAGMMKALEAMPAEQRQQLMNAALRDYEAVERVVATNAAQQMDRNINSVADSLGKLGGEGSEAAAYLRNLATGQAPPVTGEHVGRAAGRFIGDEVGILLGLAGGDVLAQQLGMESPKDRRIRELEQQVAGRA